MQAEVDERAGAAPGGRRGARRPSGIRAGWADRASRPARPGRAAPLALLLVAVVASLLLACQPGQRADELATRPKPTPGTGLARDPERGQSGSREGRARRAARPGARPTATGGADAVAPAGSPSAPAAVVETGGEAAGQAGGGAIEIPIRVGAPAEHAEADPAEAADDEAAGEPTEHTNPDGGVAEPHEALQDGASAPPNGAENAAPTASASAGPVARGEPARSDTAARTAALAARLGRALDDEPEKYGVVIEHVASGERFVYQPRRPFPAGSVYKLALAHEVLRQADEGRLALDDHLTVTADDAAEPEPDGGLAAGEEVTVREALRAMMAVSSNAAAHALLRRVDRGQLNASLAALGLGDTRVPLPDGDGQAVTTAADMADLLGWLARDATLSAASRQELRDLLALNEEPDGLVDGAPDGVTVLSKAGNLERASNVAGLVETASGPVVISVLDDDVDPGDARATIRALVRATLAAYGP